MISTILKKFSGSHYKRFIKKCTPVVAKINEIEEKLQSLSDEELKAKTPEFMKRIEGGESVDSILPEAFAVAKNASRRLCGNTLSFCDQKDLWNMVHYDVQLIGGMALHEDTIAEMATGEGKTLVATCPLYLNALTGKNCHVVTSNDYLALRDAEWMGHLYKFLGLTVGCIQNNMDPTERRKMYNCNITYGTASEFGFDYLRDNGMASDKEQQVQKDHYFCIIDEVDSILVDEARTPLIISGPMQDDNPLPFKDFKPAIKRMFSEQVKLCSKLMRSAKELLEKEGEECEEALSNLYLVKCGMPLNDGLLNLMEQAPYRRALDKFEVNINNDFNKAKSYELKEQLYYVIEEKNHQADLTENGRETIRPNNPNAYVLPDLPSIFMEIDKTEESVEEKAEKKNQAQISYEKVSEEIHTISQLLRAYALYTRDKEYVVKEGKVMIVDENTGRLMPGRRWSNGLHQAVEAKESVTIEKETRTYATITIQNYFRLYEKLCGMTGTAETEASEFNDIYRLGVMVIPTNEPNIRKDLNDQVYKTKREKFKAVVADVAEVHKTGQPILIGTASVDASEELSRLLKKANIRHAVLNAKFHQQEAEIIARAGHKGSITIATNMAGRGTDIKLEEGVDKLGGLQVIGTERHESRRIDRQLRGRCARQGDAGVTKFFISLEDDLMRLFANAGPISKILEKSLGEGEVLEHKALNWSIENAQKKVEQQNYSMRKRLLQYDDVLNKQREVIYGIRNDTLHSEKPKDIIFELIEEELGEQLDKLPGTVFKNGEEKDWEPFLNWIHGTFPLSIKLEEIAKQNIEKVEHLCLEKIKDAYAIKEQVEDSEALIELERYVIIRSIDRNWQDHLTEMEELRRAVSLRGYAQKDPLNEYKSEAYVYFEQLMETVRTEICTGIFRSATRPESFQSMINILNKNVNISGPADEDQSLIGQLKKNANAQARAQQEKEQENVELPKITIRRDEPKIGRNDPCPCGNGKKYKKCCGKDLV